MSYPTAELLERVGRRRRFSIEQKLAILTEATASGANLSEIARPRGLLPAQVYKWRRLAISGDPRAGSLGAIVVCGGGDRPGRQDVPSLRDLTSSRVLVLNLAKVGVGGSNPLARSKIFPDYHRVAESAAKWRRLYLCGWCPHGVHCSALRKFKIRHVFAITGVANRR